MNMDFGPVLDQLVKVRDNCVCTNLISKYVDTYVVSPKDLKKDFKRIVKIRQEV